MSARTSLAVLNIGWTCTRHDLRSYFTKFGKVISVRIPMSESGFNQKVAFVKMSGEDRFADSILKDYHVIDGCEVTVKLENQRQMDNITIIQKLR